MSHAFHVTYQQVVEQDGHHDDKQDPEEVGDGREGDLHQIVASLIPPSFCPKDIVKVKFPCCHSDGL